MTVCLEETIPLDGELYRRVIAGDLELAAGLGRAVARELGLARTVRAVPRLVLEGPLAVEAAVANATASVLRLLKARGIARRGLE
jgi:hypothetical protein